MSEEIKPKKFVKLAGKFVFFTGAVFVGTTLAILLSASILKPKHHPFPANGPVGIERRLPPPPMMDGAGPHHKFQHIEHRGNRPDVRRHDDRRKGDFKDEKAPVNTLLPDAETKKK